MLIKLSIQYNKKIDSEEKLKRLIHLAYKLNQKFFETELPLLKIKLFYSRKNFNYYFKKIYHQDSLAWMVAWIPSKFYIYIFSPSAFKSETSHKASNFIKVLTHEITHIFIKEIYNINQPRWLIEGLADYIAKKDFKKVKIKKIINFKLLHTFNDFKNYNSYNQSGLFAKYLLEEFGKNLLLQLIENLRNNKNDFENFKKIFKKTYKLNFNTVINNWSDNINANLDK